MRKASVEISVIMGTRYTDKETGRLKRSVYSILNQSIRELELIICDDGSTKQAVSFLDNVAADDERIKLVRRGTLFDLASKLNICFQESAGKYIARMDDDDNSHPLRIERQICYLEQHPEISFIGCNVNLICNEEPVGVRKLPAYPNVHDFYMVQPYIHPTLIFRREALEAAGGYSTDRRCVLCEDYDLLLRMYAMGYRGANLQETLLDYNVCPTAKGNRKMIHRWNETVTRCRRFYQLGLLPGTLPFVIKPLIVGLIPEPVLMRMKKRRNRYINADGRDAF